MEPWRGSGGAPVRKEDATVGRLVHQWVQRSLNTAREPKRLSAEDWRQALSGGLQRARRETETQLLAALPRDAGPDRESHALPFWWQGVLRKASWAAARCLETLSETAYRFAGGEETGERRKDHGVREAGSWLCLGKSFEGELPSREGPLHLRAHCDVLLLDRARLEGAVCQFIDIRTGGQVSVAVPTVANIENGQGLKLVGLLFLALAEGADPAGIHVGVIHPDGSNKSLLDATAAAGLQPTVEALARKQRLLVFGQRGGLVAGHGNDQAENLPLATTPIDLAVLSSKAEISR